MLSKVAASQPDVLVVEAWWCSRQKAYDMAKGALGRQAKRLGFVTVECHVGNVVSWQDI